jgi:predicted Zn-dependent peptidase
MSGGSFVMDYDQERTYFRANCLEYDTEEILQLVVDAALEPKSVMVANIAKSKNVMAHEMHS